MKKLLLASLCFLMLCASQVFAQNRTVTGTVTAKDDALPLPGVTVKVTGTSTATVTNANGKYSLSVPASAKTLTFSFVGFEPQTLNIPASNSLSLDLSSSTRELTEVVVTAGGLTATKGSQGYATTDIKPEQITAGKAANVGAALQGKVPGLQINIVSGGVNPTVSLVMRGYRSLLGNNNVLIVMDNVIVPSSLLGNINPEDIDDIQVLNGSGGAALYGSDASNGAIIITTKKGKKGTAQIKASQTISNEKVSFFPQLQTGFGSGTDLDVQIYTSTENQQYGPAFNGQLVPLGFRLQNGDIQMVPYSYNDSKYKFWQTGVSKQTDFSVQAGDDKSSNFVSGQYYTNAGILLGDNYNRASVRANGTRSLAQKVSLSYTTNYTQNRYDVAGDPTNVYQNLEQEPGQVRVTDYKDYINNEYATVDGFYNFYYQNPYFTAANNRAYTRNDILSGSMELKYDPFSFLSLTLRPAITTTNQTTKNTVNKYTTSAYTQNITTGNPVGVIEPPGTIKTNNGLGSVSDGDQYNTRITTDLFLTFKKQIKDFNVSATAGASLRQDKEQDQSVAASGLVVPGLFNVAVRTTTSVTGSENVTLTRQQAVYGVVNIGYKGYLNLHVTGRNDWMSVLPVANQSFFYPAGDISFIPTEAIDFLKNNKVLSSLKIRGGLSKVGNANINAYGLVPTFSQTAGFPFSGPGYNQGNGLVSANLRPEITKGYEFGADADLYNGRIGASITYYKTATTGQTVPISISQATGFTSYLLNTGEVDNNGIESSLTVVPIKTTTGWQLTLGANFTWANNKVISLIEGLPQLNLPNSNLYAVPGQAYPMLEGTDYNRDSQGRVIVNKQTGYPTQTTSTTNMLGSTAPRQRLGTNLELKYKSFRFSAVAEYRAGFIVQSSVSTAFDFSGGGARTAYYNRERFVFPNSSYSDGAGGYIANNTVTVADGGSTFWSQNINTNISTNYIYNGAYWKIREMNLSWDVPKNLITRQKYVKGATISLQGRNLFIWTPKSNIYGDPDFGSSGNAIGVNSNAQLPPTRYYGATLSLIF